MWHIYPISADLKPSVTWDFWFDVGMAIGSWCPMSLWMLWQRIHFRDQPPGQNAITQKPPLTSLERVLRGLVIMMPFMFIHIPFMYCDIYIIHIYIYIHTYTHIYSMYIYIYISYVYINLRALRISPYFYSYVHLCAVHGSRCFSGASTGPGGSCTSHLRDSWAAEGWESQTWENYPQIHWIKCSNSFSGPLEIIAMSSHVFWCSSMINVSE